MRGLVKVKRQDISFRWHTLTSSKLSTPGTKELEGKTILVLCFNAEGIVLKEFRVRMYGHLSQNALSQQYWGDSTSTLSKDTCWNNSATGNSLKFILGPAAVLKLFSIIKVLFVINVSRPIQWFNIWTLLATKTTSRIELLDFRRWKYLKNYWFIWSFW